MATSSRWEEIRARKLADPAARERYERTRRSTAATRQVLQLIDAERGRAGLTKAELARRVGTNPAGMRRLLSSDASNPTLRTMLEILDTLGLQFIVQPKTRESGTAGRKAPSAVQADPTPSR